MLGHYLLCCYHVHDGRLRPERPMPRDGDAAESNTRRSATSRPTYNSKRLVAMHGLEMGAQGSADPFRAPLGTEDLSRINEPRNGLAQSCGITAS